MTFKIESKKLELKVNWKISRNESTFKENFFLSLCDNQFDLTSEIAPNIRYGETRERILDEYSELLKTENIDRKIVQKSNWSNSFKCAVMNLLLKLDAAKENKTLEDYLELKKIQKVKTSFSIPIMDPSLVKKYLELNSGFHSYKLKVIDSTSFDLLKEVSTLTDKSLRVDANEGFKSLEDYLEFEKKIASMNIEFIEQPFAAAMVDAYRSLKPISKFEIIADESVESDFDGELFRELFHGVNIKQMKAGGIERSKYLLEKAKSFNLKTMIGCMIESSLGIKEAISLVSLCDYIDLDGALLLSNDPYDNLIKLEDGYLIS